MNETAETQAYQVVAAANSALELAAEGLAMFEERRPDIVGYGPAFPATGQRRIELMRPGALERRAYIGAQAFISNVVIVQNSLARLTKIAGLPDVIKQGAKAAHDKVQGLVDRRVRHTIEHIDQRAVDTADRSLVSSTFLEGDLLCSTRDDGSVGTVEITREVLDQVAAAMDGVFWPKETLDRIVAWAEEREARRAGKFSGA
jgi:hypothetical protein